MPPLSLLLLLLNPLLATSYTKQPLFSFLDPATTKDIVNQFSRIDDTIMGGVSSSALTPKIRYASFAGKIRTTGGGFCGLRTLPFTSPIVVTPLDSGIYIKCQFLSDNEPERRVWKLSIRNDSSRGEQVFQAELGGNLSTTEMTTTYLPFSDFKVVRGARLLEQQAPFLKEKEDGENMLFQIGLTVSCFPWGKNLVKMDNFREGPFELGIEELGLFSDADADANADAGKSSAVQHVQTLTEDEVKAKRPMAFKIVSKLFSEKARRRTEALRLLREERGMSYRALLRFGRRARGEQRAQGVLTMSSILLKDVSRKVVFKALKYTVFKPLGMVFKLKKKLNKKTSKKVVEEEEEALPASNTNSNSQPKSYLDSL
ncbi:hypothetical protein ScalyP_jg11305 [Parmales sp. scaly parma]|nr:hypothetical protein ScalyP_jg11305 [Parmales sp. scaly parma]